MSIEAMKQALEALEGLWDDGFGGVPESMHKDAITALRQAIEQAEKQEPVAFVSGYYGGQCVILPIYKDKLFSPGTALYTAPVHASDIPQERVDETAKDRHEPESNNVEIAAEQSDNYAAFLAGVRFARVNLPAPSKEWVGLTDGEMVDLLKNYEGRLWTDIFPAIEAKLKEKNT
jgi:hypothetical protein